MKSIHEWQAEQAFLALENMAGTNHPGTPAQPAGFHKGDNEDLDTLLKSIAPKYQPWVLRLASKLQAGEINTPKRKAAIIAMFMSALGVEDLASLGPVLAIVKKNLNQGVVAGAAAGAAPTATPAA